MFRPWRKIQEGGGAICSNDWRGKNTQGVERVGLEHQRETVLENERRVKELQTQVSQSVGIWLTWTRNWAEPGMWAEIESISNPSLYSLDDSFHSSDTQLLQKNHVSSRLPPFFREEISFPFFFFTPHLEWVIQTQFFKQDLKWYFSLSLKNESYNDENNEINSFLP